MTVGSDPFEGSETRSYEANPTELVHEARKAIKRMRALARLLRHELGGQEFKRVNDSLRDASRRLAGARDADVRLATLSRLVERHPKALGLEGIQLLGERLERERTQTTQPADGDRVLEDIAAMRRQAAEWKLFDHDFEALAPGLQRIYGEGRHRHAQVKHGHARNAQDLHDWRKRVKSLYYALDMLGAKQTKSSRPTAQSAERLGDLLGEEHDLWMLRVYVEEHPGAFGSDAAAQGALLERIQRRRKRLRKRSLRLGTRLYRRKPSKFTRRIGAALSA